MGFLESLSKRLPDHIPLLEALGHLYTENGRIKDGLAMDLKLTSLCPKTPLYWYNLGCSYALLDEVNPAFKALEQAIGLGYHDVDWLRKDSDLDKLRKDPRFQKLIDMAGKSDHQAS